MATAKVPARKKSALKEPTFTAACESVCWFQVGVAAGLPAVDPSVVTRARSADDC